MNKLSPGSQGTGSASNTDTYDLFVAFAAEDAAFVRGYLIPALNLAADRVLLLDALPLGGIAVSEIDRAVSCSRFAIVVLSPAFLVERLAEFAEQLASHLNTRASQIIPLRLSDCEIPLRLDARLALDFTDPANWAMQTWRLRDRLQARPPVSEPLACPYPGMRPFDESDASRFFGRDEEIDDLIGRLDREEHEIYVIGPSGSGKSSLVRAGLLHKLDAATSRLGRLFTACTIRPGERPVERLCNALDADLATPAQAVAAVLANHQPAERLLVFVDQLEELFTLASAAERQRFVALLRTLRVVPQCYLVLALRADFFGALLDSELGQDFARRRSPVVVAPMRSAALIQAIRLPAQLARVHIDPRLCDRLVAEAADAPGALPHIQEALRLLWDKRRERYIGLEAYAALGDGVTAFGAAIARRADLAMAGLTPSQQIVARRMLLRLVSFGEGRADTRRQLTLCALESYLQPDPRLLASYPPQDPRAHASSARPDPEVAQVLQQLVEHRLLTVDTARANHETLVDLSHEALIAGWPDLRRWLDARRADELRRRQFEGKVAEWIARGRGTASLLDPVELSEIEQWMQSEAAQELGFGAELVTLVAASRREIKEQTSQHRLRKLFSVIWASFVALVILVVWQERRETPDFPWLPERGRGLSDRQRLSGSELPASPPSPPEQGPGFVGYRSPPYEPSAGEHMCFACTHQVLCGVKNALDGTLLIRIPQYLGYEPTKAQEIASEASETTCSEAQKIAP